MPLPEEPGAVDVQQVAREEDHAVAHLVGIGQVGAEEIVLLDARVS